MAFSPYVAFVDESGDPGMGNFDPGYPVFVLCAVLYSKSEYTENDLRALSQLKMDLWGHDAVVFHSYKIRKKVPPFYDAADPTLGTRLMQGMTNFYNTSLGVIIAAAIDKPKHKQKYKTPTHPYELSLQFCLERIYGHIRNLPGGRDTTICVFEKRGRAEDARLETHFNYIVAGANMWGKLPFKAVFAGKEENVSGLQIADLAAYPIARYVETNNANRPDWQAVSQRIRRGPEDKMLGWGLKIFP